MERQYDKNEIKRQVCAKLIFNLISLSFLPDDHTLEYD